MAAIRTLTRAALVVLLGAGIAVSGCSDRTEVPAGPATPSAHLLPDLRGALAAQQRHTDALLRMSGVVGTAVTLLPDGRPAVQILLERAGLAGLPQSLDGIPVALRVTGRLMAFSDPTTRQRPAPMGFSVGHPAITAGTIGARVRDALGRVYVLSNNHVLANSNGATIGDPEYQPGPFDGGTAADQIATLSDFQTISFATNGANTIDAAIALSSSDQLDNATPADDGYGMPNSTIYADSNGDGLFDNRDALLGLAVQKYGRTTRLTHGQITGVNATVSVCYEVVGLVCTKQARYVDQFIIEPGTFSGGGDSGSLIVTDDGNVNPVALLFAGSSTVTIGNRIDLVLQRFGVTIDGFAPPPPGPFRDVAVTGVSGPSRAVQATTSSVTVTVKNFGNQDVAAFDVTLQDTTEHVTVGTQTIPGLTAGTGATLTFTWTPALTGDHVLAARQTLPDDRATNDQRWVTIPVDPPVNDVAVSSFVGATEVIVGHGVNVGVTVTNAGNQNVTTPFDVTVRDSTAGTTLGTQTVSALAAGAATTLVFSWNTSGAALGGHTLVATQSLADDDATNDRLTEVITVKPKPVDIALTGITAPSSVTQGDTAHVVVTVQNVGEVNVDSAFAVVLADGTAGGAIVATRSVAGLAVGATTTVDLPWNTAGASVAGHTLIATQKLADDVSTNNSIAIGINVNPAPPPPSTDVAVTTTNAPAAITQGGTATIGVTVQNMGGVNITSSFTVTLVDSTTGTTLGTQAVNGLATSALATVSFTWNTTGAALGGHTLVASHSLTDDNAANNRRSAVVQVNAQPVDIALTGISAPSRVTQGDIVAVSVSVQNVSGPDVTTSFDVVLNDATAGVIIGTQTIAGLAAGTSATRTFSWNTAGVALNGHTLIATQKLADANVSNNSAATGVNVIAPPTTDVAVTGVTAPATATQGSTVAVGVNISNVGGLSVTTSFDIVLTDATAGTTIGTQTLTGLAAGSGTTRTFNWNTTGAAVGGHTLTATITLSDANSANNQASAAITLNAPTLDVSVTSLSAPGTVTLGSTATVNVTVQNIGGLNVTSTFNVVLTDATSGTTIGTQAVAGLAPGVSASRSFTWSTVGAPAGAHTLVASHTLADDNAANNQRSASVTITTPPADIALSGLTAPSSVTQGDTVAVVVSVQNVGGQDAATSFDVVLTDATAGVTIGTQTIPGLAAGASVTRTITWYTAGVAMNGHTLMATQKYSDNNAGNNSRSIGVTVKAPSVHVGDLDATTLKGDTAWWATVVATAHDARHNPLAGVTVSGTWGSGTVSCTTGADGTCSIVSPAFPLSNGIVSFGVSALTAAGYVYTSSANHDPDGSSNGYSIIVRRP